MIFSLVPNMEYYITKYNVEKEITFSDSSALKEDNISDLFWQNLQKNNKLTAEEKELIYDSFKEYFLDKYSKYLDENKSFYYEGEDVIKKFAENKNQKLENFNFMYNVRYFDEDDTIVIVAYTNNFPLEEDRHIEYKYTLDEFVKLDFDKWCKMANEDIKDVPIETKIYK